jgi:acyl-CoA synthetase (AMP-forming)/AMP-acid ligase II
MRNGGVPPRARRRQSGNWRGNNLSSLSELVLGVLALAPAEPSIEFEGAWHTWGEISSGMASIRRIIESSGLAAEGRVGILLRNCPEFVPAILDAVVADRCLVTLNPIGSEEKLSAEILQSEVPVLIAAPSEWSKRAIHDAAVALGALGIEVTSAPGVLSATQVVEPRKDLWKRTTAPAIAVEMLSSGTTGAPKRIPLPRSTFTRSVLDFLTFEKGGMSSTPRLRSGVQFLITPFGHIGGLGRLLMAITSGRKSCLFERFDAQAFRSAIVRHRPKVVSGPPTVLRMLLNADTPREDLSSLVAFRSGMAPLDPDLADEFTARYGIAVLQNYGATEFGGGIAGWTMDDYKAHRSAKRGSVGRLNAGVEARTLDPESGEILAPGTPGLLEIRAPHIYEGRWVRTTDLAVVDEVRFLWLKGRADNAIIRGGFKVLPDEVAKVIGTHPAIAEVSVVGIPDARLGQIPVAAVTLKPDVTRLDLDELKAFLRDHLNLYQIPVSIKVVKALPRLETLKVDTSVVKKLFLE